MRFLVYGAGALGQALGCMLACDNHSVDFILRERFIEPIRENGLKVTGIFGDFFAPEKNVTYFTSLENISGSYDYILLTTKSYDTQASVDALKSVPGRDGTAVVSLQNGCGNIEKLIQGFGAAQTIGGRVITGFEIERPGHVIITVCADDIHVGDGLSGAEITEQTERLAAAITSAGHKCLAVDNIHSSLYAKLLYNCALNPLGAILGVNYGPLAEQESTRDIMNRVIEETFAVIEGMGGTTPWPDAAAYREVFYSTLIPATADHRPSMLQDLENGKPTEVEALVGYVSRKGRQSNIATPTCDTLADLVRFKEMQSRILTIGKSSNVAG